MRATAMRCALVSGKASVEELAGWFYADGSAMCLQLEVPGGPHAIEIMCNDRLVDPALLRYGERRLSLCIHSPLNIWLMDAASEFIASERGVRCEVQWESPNTVEYRHLNDCCLTVCVKWNPSIPIAMARMFVLADTVINAMDTLHACDIEHTP